MNLYTTNYPRDVCFLEDPQPGDPRVILAGSLGLAKNAKETYQYHSW